MATSVPKPPRPTIAKPKAPPIQQVKPAKPIQTIKPGLPKAGRPGGSAPAGSKSGLAKPRQPSVKKP